MKWLLYISDLVGGMSACLPYAYHISMPRQQTRAGRGFRTDRYCVTRQTRSTTASRFESPMANPRENPSTNRQYMFIEQDASRSTSSEAIRVHVMRESHRARRQLRGLIHAQNNQGQMTILTNQVPSNTRPIQNESTEDTTDQPLRRGSETTPPLAVRESLDAPLNLKKIVQRRLSDILSTSAQIAAASPGMTILKQLPENIVALCGDDPAALHALLALIASVQQSVSIVQAANYESAALEILRTRIADADKVEHVDETILTVLLLSRVEVGTLRLGKSSH